MIKFAKKPDIFFITKIQSWIINIFLRNFFKPTLRFLKRTKTMFSFENLGSWHPYHRSELKNSCQNRSNYSKITTLWGNIQKIYHYIWNFMKHIFRRIFKNQICSFWNARKSCFCWVFDSVGLVHVLLIVFCWNVGQ